MVLFIHKARYKLFELYFSVFFLENHSYTVLFRSCKIFGGGRGWVPREVGLISSFEQWFIDEICLNRDFLYFFESLNILVW